MNPPLQRYPTPKDFRQAVTQRVKVQAAARGRSIVELQREFIYQRFLARVFHPATAINAYLRAVSACWFAYRSPGSARTSTSTTGPHGLEQAIANLRTCATIPGLDPFNFQVGGPSPLRVPADGIHYRSAYNGDRSLALWNTATKVHVDPSAGADIALDHPGMLAKLKVELELRHIVIRTITTDQCERCP